MNDELQQPKDIFSDVDPVKGTNAKPVGPTQGTAPVSSSLPPRRGVPGSAVIRFLPIAIGGILVIAAGVYFLFFRGPSVPIEGNEDGTTQEQQNTQQQGGDTQEPTEPPPSNTLQNVPVDTDGDGLSDDDELSRYGTNVRSLDSDGDGLSDREEVIIYLTDPLKVDTDGDSFSDSVEIKGGYNPKGPGKLFDIPQ